MKKRAILMAPPFQFAAALPNRYAPRRQELLAAARAGTLDKVEFQAEVFNNTYPNLNFFRFRDRDLKKLAKSSIGQPFLRDHGGGGLFTGPSIASRGGTIVDADVIEGEDGRMTIGGTIEAVKPWAQEGVLDGTIDRFSIGWRSEGYECTVCGREFGDNDEACREHFPGDKYGEQVCEVLCLAPRMVEWSAVVTPAVPGTKVIGVMAAASDAGVYATARDFVDFWNGPQIQTLTGNFDAHGIPPGRGEQEAKMLEKIRKMLNLPAAATEGEAFAALELLVAGKGNLGMIAQALGLPADSNPTDVVGKVIGLTAPGATVSREEHEKVRAQATELERVRLVEKAVKAGKVTPAMRPWAEDWSQKNLEAFRSWEANAPVLVPIASSFDVPPLHTGDVKPAISAEERAFFAKMGITEEREMLWAKSIPQYGETPPYPQAAAK